MKVLITGGSGKLGKELKRIYSDVLTPSHLEMDIVSLVSVNNYLRKNEPDVIIHCAALTSVEFCEHNQMQAYLVNVIGTRNLLQCCKSKTVFVFISSACVFRGDRGNYTEEDLPYPHNYYGLTKLLAENTVANSNRPFLIVRTNFVAKEHWAYPKAFTDRYGTYLYASDVAHAIKELISDNFLGTIHVCGDKKISMYELAKMTTPCVQPTTLKEHYLYHSSTPLTKDMSLCSYRIKPYRLGEFT